MNDQDRPNWLKSVDALPGLQYTREQATANAELLCTALGAKWLRRGSEGPQRFSHLLLNAWASTSVRAFMQLNSLAEDLRVLSTADFLDVVVDDLKIEKECSAAWHALHAAALFGRTPGQKVVKFFPKNQTSAPDFLVQVGTGQLLAVEAKLLMQSEPELRFVTYGKGIQSLLFSRLLPLSRQHPFVTVVVKDPETLPRSDEVLANIEAALQQYRSSSVVKRSLSFNVFVDPTPLTATPFEAYRGLQVLAPRSPTENIRVLDRTKKAAKQLKALDNGRTPGIFCIGLTQHQDPHWLSTRLAERFGAGNYSGIASAILMARIDAGRPDEMLVDFAVPLHNPRARVSAPPFGLHSTGLFGQFSATAPKAIGVSAYQYSGVESRVGTSPGTGRLEVAAVGTLQPEMLT